MQNQNSKVKVELKHRAYQYSIKIIEFLDAIKGYLESLKKHNEPIPLSIEEEIVEVRV